MSDCKVYFCSDYDEGSEDCCWSAFPNECKLRKILEGGVLYVYEENILC